jgi:hypothetical protein
LASPADRHRSPPGRCGHRRSRCCYSRSGPRGTHPGTTADPRDRRGQAPAPSCACLSSSCPCPSCPRSPSARPDPAYLQAARRGRHGENADRGATEPGYQSVGDPKSCSLETIATGTRAAQSLWGVAHALSMVKIGHTRESAIRHRPPGAAVEARCQDGVQSPSSVGVLPTPLRHLPDFLSSGRIRHPPNDVAGLCSSGRGVRSPWPPRWARKTFKATMAAP